MKDTCKTPGCESDAKCLDLCSACYSYAYYWNQKPAQALIKRQHQIQMYTTRMDMMGAPVSIKHVRISAKLRLSSSAGTMPGTTRTQVKHKMVKTA